MSLIILIRPVWKHGPRSLVWMRDSGLLKSIITSNLDRVYRFVMMLTLRAVFFLARAAILGPERW